VKNHIIIMVGGDRRRRTLLIDFAKYLLLSAVGVFVEK
jgi:hypothetical protein